MNRRRQNIQLPNGCFLRYGRQKTQSEINYFRDTSVEAYFVFFTDNRIPYFREFQDFNLKIT